MTFAKQGLQWPTEIAGADFEYEDWIAEFEKKYGLHDEGGHSPP
jgi:hypothetical protein